MRRFLTRLGRVDWLALGVAGAIFYAVEFLGDPLLFLSGARVGYKLKEYFFTGRPLLYAAIGLITLLLGWSVALKVSWIKRLPNPWADPWNEGRARLVFVFCFIIGLTVKIVRVVFGGWSLIHTNPAFLASPFYSTIGFLDWFGPFAMALALAMAFQTKGEAQHRFWIMAARGSFALEILYAIPSCWRTLILMPLVIWLIAGWYLQGKSYKLLMIVGAIILLLFPYGNICRNPKVLQSYSVISTPALTMDAPAFSWKHGAVFMIDSVLSRVEQFSIFQAIVLKKEPVWKPLFLRDLILNMGPPRFIWQSKPAISAGGGALGREIGVLPPNDYTTSIAPSLPGDWYLQFGFWGVVIGMFLMGVLWRFIYEYFVNSTARAAPAIAVYSLVWIRVLMGMENYIAPSYAGLIKMLIAFAILAYFAREKPVLL